MPHQIGFVDNSGAKLAHQAMLEVVMNFAAASGWTVMRFDDSSASHELILKAPGMAGTDEIYVGLQTYENANADYYNLLAAAFTGYVAGNTFDTQPGFISSGVPAHNQRIDYWLTLNGQRLILAMKVGTPVYQSCYLGKMLPYGRPSQYPYPVVCGGMLNGAAAVRFSDTAHSCWVKGGYGRIASPSLQWPNMRLRFNSGAWMMPQCWPWNNQYLTGSSYQARDTGGVQPLIPVVLSDATSGVLGELDGVCFVPGFGNAVENTIAQGGQTWVVMQDVYRTGFIDYYAVRMDD